MLVTHFNNIFRSNFVVSLIKVGFAFIVSLFILNIGAILFGYSGSRYLNLDKYTDYHFPANRLLINIEEGISYQITDDNGMNNYNVIVQPKLLLMGDSHFEGHQVNQNENVGYLLSEYTNSNVYNIGTSSHDIYCIVQNLQSALQYFSDVETVVLETSDINIIEEKASLVFDSKYPENSHNSSNIIWIQNLFPCIFKLRISVNNWNRIYNDKTENNTVNQDAIYQIVEYISRIANATKVIIVYQPLTLIDKSGCIVNNADTLQRGYFTKACNDNGIIFLDMTDPFIKLYEEHHILAHGFINTAVGVGHLNKYGHQLIAEQLAEVIMEDEEK